MYTQCVINSLVAEDLILNQTTLYSSQAIHKFRPDGSLWSSSFYPACCGCMVHLQL